MAGGHWSRAEVEATVLEYVDMLTLELAGESFNKRERNERLRERLDDRSRQAVEYRLFEFRHTPKLFTLPGNVEQHVALRAINYRAYL